ncbi:11264_t:CDS:2, partial [Entrophospora sp. SA101]
VEQEKLQLALFWYREKLLQKVKATWECLLTNQRGTVDIRSLRLNKSMLNVLKINEISYGIDIYLLDKNLRSLSDALEIEEEFKTSPSKQIIK